MSEVKKTHRYKLTFFVRDASGKSYQKSEYFTNYKYAVQRAEETHGWLFIQKWKKIYPADNDESS